MCPKNVILHAGKADAAWEEDDEQLALGHDHQEDVADALVTEEPPVQVCTFLWIVKSSWVGHKECSV